MEVGALNAAGTDGGLRVKINSQATYETENNRLYSSNHKCVKKTQTWLIFHQLQGRVNTLGPAASVSNLRFSVYLKVSTSFSLNNDQPQKNPSLLLPFSLPTQDNFLIIPPHCIKFNTGRRI